MSDSNASAIEPATVSLVLNYLVPLDAPLPPHLLSRPLLKRHHFLSLSIDNPHEYLAWPSDSYDTGKAVTLLLGGSHFRNPHDLSLTVRYSADEESLAAHVAVSTSGSGSQSVPGTLPFRLIFLWDPSDAWQYHNIALMPFPRDTYPTIADAYGAFNSPHDFIPEPSYTLSVSGADEDDDYWNSYGQDLDDEGSHGLKSAAKPQHDPNSEDAYWARYSSIHGSADSTIPSPLPVKRGPDGVQTHGEERVFVTIPNANPNEEPYNPLEPPSPDELTRRLASLVARPASPPFDEEASSEDSDLAATPDLPSQQAEAEEPHPSSLHEISPIKNEQPLSATDTPPDVAGRSSPKFGSADSTAPEDESDAALQHSIQGLYRLWKLEQQRKQTSQDAEAFLALVRRTIQEP